MQPEKPTHGTNARYIAGCRCDPCRKASLRYSKRLKADKQLGRERTVESWRAVRRLDALACLGWSRGAIASEMGIKHKCQVYDIGNHPRIYKRTLNKLDEVYQRLSMKLPDPQTTAQRIAVTKTQRNAQKRGALPPMAWDNIDDPNERPDLYAKDSGVDEIVVVRVLGGDFNLEPNRAERFEILRRWSGTDNELERATGWNVARMRRDLNTNNEEAA